MRGSLASVCVCVASSLPELRVCLFEKLFRFPRVTTELVVVIGLRRVDLLISLNDETLCGTQITVLGSDVNDWRLGKHDSAKGESCAHCSGDKSLVLHNGTFSLQEWYSIVLNYGGIDFLLRSDEGNQCVISFSNVEVPGMERRGR